MNTGKHTSWILALMLATAPMFAAGQSQTEEAGQKSAQQESAQQQTDSQNGETSSTSQTRNAVQGGQKSGEKEQKAAKEGQEAAGKEQKAATDNGKADKSAGSQQMFVPSQSEGELLASELEGVAVMNASEEELGNVQNVLMDDASRIRALVVGVGGFLGLGEKPVAVSYDRFQQSRNQEGKIMLTLEATRDQLEQAPAFTTLAQQRAEQERAQQQQQAAEQQQTSGDTASGQTQ